MATTVIYGESASEKTENADRLARHFGCDKIVDPWTTTDGLTEGALHLTSDHPYAVVTSLPDGTDTMSFKRAMQAIKRKESNGE